MKVRPLIIFAVAAASAVLVWLDPNAASAIGRLRLPIRPVSLEASLNTAGSEASCCETEPCCPKPCITYRHRGRHTCCPMGETVQTVLVVCDPCTGCPVEVPVCLPACCADAPTMHCGIGPLGRANVVFDWCCGYEVIVRFKRNGDLIVITHG